MYPILLDIKTGRTADAKDMDNSILWWSLGNGSCDCNRAVVIGDDVENELSKQFPEGCCFGSNRMVAIDVHGDLEGMTKKEVLKEINDEYPEEYRKYWDKT